METLEPLEAQVEVSLEDKPNNSLQRHCLDKQVADKGIKDKVLEAVSSRRRYLETLQEVLINLLDRQLHCSVVLLLNNQLQVASQVEDCLDNNLELLDKLEAYLEETNQLSKQPYSDHLQSLQVKLNLLPVEACLEELRINQPDRPAYLGRHSSLSKLLNQQQVVDYLEVALNKLLEAAYSDKTRLDKHLEADSLATNLKGKLLLVEDFLDKTNQP